MEARPRSPLPPSTLDRLLTLQLVVAWAGEGGEEPRLGWWRSFMLHEYGGEALLGGITPRTWHWAAWQGAREAARRTDAAARATDHDPDRLVTLFHLGFELDERLDERLLDHKRSGRAPRVALPALAELCSTWNPAAFGEWSASQGAAAWAPAPAGRRLTGEFPADPERAMRNLVSALTPTPVAWPAAHYRLHAKSP